MKFFLYRSSEKRKSLDKYLISPFNADLASNKYYCQIKFLKNDHLKFLSHFQKINYF